MRDSLSAALSDALVVAPLMHVVHLHAQRSANPSGTFFYHFQGVQQTPPPSAHDAAPESNWEYHVSLNKQHPLIWTRTVSPWNPWPSNTIKMGAGYSEAIHQRDWANHASNNHQKAKGDGCRH